MTDPNPSKSALGNIEIVGDNQLQQAPKTKTAAASKSPKDDIEVWLDSHYVEYGTSCQISVRDFLDIPNIHENKKFLHDNVIDLTQTLLLDEMNPRNVSVLQSYQAFFLYNLASGNTPLEETSSIMRRQL